MRNETQLLLTLPVSVAGLGIREMVASVVMGILRLRSGHGFSITQAQAVTASFLLFLVNGLMPGLIGIGVGTRKISSFSAIQDP